jgi:hypothetical protein
MFFQQFHISDRHAAVHRFAQTVRVGWGQSIHAIMVADIHRDDFLVLNQQLQRDAV